MSTGAIASIRDLVLSLAADLGGGGLSPAARALVEALEDGALRADAFTADEALRAATPPDGPDGAISTGTPAPVRELQEAGLLAGLADGLFSVAHGLDGVYATRALLPRPSAISGPSALNFWGLSEQVPLVVYCTSPATDPRSPGSPPPPPDDPHPSPGARLTLPNGVPCEYAGVAPEAFFGISTVPYDLGLKLSVFDRERAMLDLFARPDLHPFGEAMTVLEGHAEGADLGLLVRYAERLGSPPVAGRLGWALDAVAAGLLAELPPERLRALEDLATYGGPRPALLDPSLPERGPAHPRWTVRVNLPGPRDAEDAPPPPAARRGAAG